jgi:hypothetical protein
VVLAAATVVKPSPAVDIAALAAGICLVALVLIGFKRGWR